MHKLTVAIDGKTFDVEVTPDRTQPGVFTVHLAPVEHEPDPSPEPNPAPASSPNPAPAHAGASPAPITIYVPDAQTPNPGSPADGEASGVDWMLVDHRPYELTFAPDLRTVQLKGRRHTVHVRDQTVRTVRPAAGDGRIKAPIPGLIARLHVEPGQRVEPGQSLLVLEAMKMENEIRAPKAGVVRAISVKPGQTVSLNEPLLEIE